MKAQLICNFKRLPKWSWIGKQIIFLVCLLANCVEAKTFRIHSPSEPDTINPQHASAGSSQYLLYNLYSNLLKFSENKLQPDLASRCYRKTPKEVHCLLRNNIFWSDGSKISVQDFLESYKRLLDLDSKASRPDLLFTVENAEEIYNKKKPFSDIGILEKKNELIFKLKNFDPDFEFKLANIILAPIKNIVTDSDKITSQIFSGPFTVSRWNTHQRLTLIKNNKYWDHKNISENSYEYVFVKEPNIAIELFKKNELDFVRNVPTLQFSNWKNKKEFLWFPVLRFDYIGMKEDKSLRKRLATGLKYEELQKIFYAPERPGCFALEKDWFTSSKNNYCYNFLSSKGDLFNVDYYFSTAGGDDHRKTSEWLQQQWGLNSNIYITPKSIENKTFLENLSKYKLFRKGFPLDRPTCLAAIEAFSAKHPENYISWNNEKYNSIIKSFYDNQLSVRDKKRQCEEAIKILFNEYALIPLGKIWFSILKKEDLKFEINELNNLYFK